MTESERRGDKVVSDVSIASHSGTSIAKSDYKELARAVPWRVFINQIDSYHASHLADLLRNKLYIPPSESPRERTESEEEKNGEEEGEENKVAEDEIKKEKQSPRKFELVATKKITSAEECKAVYKDVTIIPARKVDKKQFISKIFRCGVIIYDISQDVSQVAEANWVLNELVRALNEEQQLCKGVSKKTSIVTHSFILISSVTTWAGGSNILSESDHWKRKRRAHPNYQEELQCERNVTAAAASRKRAVLPLRTCVVCAGLTYGEGESLLEYAFKLAWLNNSWLPVVGHGRNLVPLLHVCDLANAVYAVMREWPESNYVLAVEKGSTTQKALITAVSRALSTGRVKSISAEEALAYRDVTQCVLDGVTLDLDLRASHLFNSTSMQWRSTSPFCDNIHAIVSEFLAARSLQPVKLIILGPPASGKTQLAKALAKYYRLHRLSLDTIVPDTIRQLTDELKESEEMENDAEGEDGEGEEEEDMDNENGKDLGVIQSLLEEIQSNLRENNGRLNDDLLVKIFRRKLESKECQNQGYILDGYPKTLEQAKLLFGHEDNLESEEKPSEANPLPHLVIALEASDHYLLQRLINLSERDLLNSGNTEQRFYQRLQTYRQSNDDDGDTLNTPFQLFDDLEIHPVVVDIEKDDHQMSSTFRYCLTLLGPPNKYGATEEELEEEKRRIEEEEGARAAEDATRREIERAQLQNEREERACQWMDLLEKLKREEEERLRIRMQPLRHYLAKHVFPTLTPALLELAKLRPNDTIDYLAEYLFKLNPSGRAFEPDYSGETSKTLETMQNFQDEGVLPSLAGRSVDAFECPESSVGSQSDKCLCSSYSSSESNNDSSPGEEFNECG